MIPVRAKVPFGECSRGKQPMPDSRYCLESFEEENLLRFGFIYPSTQAMGCKCGMVMGVRFDF